MAAEDHSQAPKFPAPSLPYEAHAPMLSPPTSYAPRQEYALPLIEQQQPLNQLDQPDRSERAMDKRRIVAVVVFIALLASVVAVILVLRYRPEDRVVIWVLTGLIGLLAFALLVILFPGCPSAALTCCPSPALF